MQGLALELNSSEWVPWLPQFLDSCDYLHVPLTEYRSFRFVYFLTGAIYMHVCELDAHVRMEVNAPIARRPRIRDYARAWRIANHAVLRTSTRMSCARKLSSLHQGLDSRASSKDIVPAVVRRPIPVSQIPWLCISNKGYLYDESHDRDSLYPGN